MAAPEARLPASVHRRAGRPDARDEFRRVPVFKVLVAFARIGSLSFGGAAATQLLLRKELVSNRRWMDDDEFNRWWRISKLSLGINMIAQVILYGRRLAGFPGILVALAGFILPSILATVLISVLLLSVIDNQYVRDALRVVVPVTGGMTMAIALQMWNPRIPRGSLRAWLRLVSQAAIVCLSALLVGVVHVPVPLIMIAAIAAGAAVAL